MAFGLSAASIGTIMQGCQGEATTDTMWSPSYFSQSEANTLAELSERIFPKTDTPGAKDAGVHQDIDTYAKIAMSEEERTMFKSALADVDKRSKSKFSSSYVDITDEQKDEILMDLANEAENAKDGDKPFFSTLKGMVLYTYMTSEVGATQFLKYDPVPGVYECVDYASVGGIWAL